MDADHKLPLQYLKYNILITFTNTTKRTFCENMSAFKIVHYSIIELVIAIAKCQKAKQKLENDRTELCKY